MERTATQAMGCVVLSLGVCPAAAVEEESAMFVQKGKALAVEQVGEAWSLGDGSLSNQGTRKYLFAGRGLGAGDVRVRARIALEQLNHTAASFMIDERSHFGFDGAGNRLFVEGRLFGHTTFIGNAADYITPGEPFDFEAVREGNTLAFAIDGQEVYRKDVGDGPLGSIALRPWRATMRVFDFGASGSLVDPPPRSSMSRGHALPIIDLSGQTRRHVVVAEGSQEVYQGHPTTLLMPDGRTLFCVWTLDHGGPCGPMKRSEDGGRTWGELLGVPENWKDVRNCPAVHRLVDPAGTARLFVFAGNGDMFQAVSEDEGQTWSPMRTNGLKCVVAPMTVTPVDGGRRHLMWVHRGWGDRDRSPLTVWQAGSGDGGVTWGDFRRVVAVPGADPCEPAVIRSPDGRQLLMLMRENRRRFNSLYAVSNDEGASWSEAKELTGSLTGDRHCARYASDGRLVVCFRDQAEGPTRGHFIAWVGAYEDIIAGREGQFRVRLLHSHAGGDCGYPGLERLPDGTLLATTYVKYRPGPRKHSVVSVRFTLEDVDREADGAPVTHPLYRRGTDGYHTYRIPGLVTTAAGTLLAFCEGRRNSASDHGDVDIVLKRSRDGGRTWSAQQLVQEEGGRAEITIGNPCPVVDRSTGTVWLTFCRDNDRVFLCRSEDDGATWSERVEITGAVKEPQWSWFATGPGHGIQLERGRHRGRLVIPCDCRDTTGTGDWGRKGRSFVIYSDDHGRTWQCGGVTGPGMNECEVVELADGVLLLSMRNYHGKDLRAFARSTDGGETWSEPRHHEEVYCPTCQSSLHRHSWAPEDTILYAGPAGPGRQNLTIRASRDGGKTWPEVRTLQFGPSAYSDLAVLPNGTVACLYETGRDSAYETITFARFDLVWLGDR